MARARRQVADARHPSPADRSAAAPLRAWPWLLGLVLLLTLAWVPSLDAPFVFDDASTIVDNPYLTRLWPLRESMRAPVQSSVSGRPVAALSLAVSHALGGLTPMAFRVWNLAVLAATGLLLWALVRDTWGARPDADDRTAAVGALAVAGLWLLHPINTEVVGYVTQRTESMMGACTLLTMFAAARHMRAPGAGGWAALAVLACATGMGCKESMVVAPLLVLLYDVVFVAGSARAAVRARPWLYAALAATWLVLAACIAGNPRFRSAGLSAGVSPGMYLLNQAIVLPEYLELAIWPSPLLVDYGRSGPVALTAALPGLVLIGAALVAVAAAWRRHRVLAFLGTWCVLTLAPSSSLVPIATEAGAERRMFLPLMAVAVLAVIGAQAAARRWGAPVVRTRRVAALVTAALVAALAAGSAARAHAYTDPIGLWRQVVEVRPQPRAHYNLGIVLAAAGRTAEAIDHYRQALPGEPAAGYALGFELIAAGRLEDGVTHLETFLGSAPEDIAAPPAAFVLGQTLRRLGRAADAERWLREALRMTPASADARLALANLLSEQQRHAEAVPLYEDYVRRVPGHAAAFHNLGIAHYATGQTAAAVPAFERAVALAPDDTNMRASLGHALAAAGRLDDAAAQYRAVLQRTPGDARVTSSLALVRAAAGARGEALALFARARQLAPGDPQIAADYAEAMAHLR